jgi:hypothetical protein
MIGRVEGGVDALPAMKVLFSDLIIPDYRQDLGPMPLRSALASNFPAIKSLVFAEESVPLRSLQFLTNLLRKK